MLSQMRNRRLDMGRDFTKIVAGWKTHFSSCTTPSLAISHPHLHLAESQNEIYKKLMKLFIWEGNWQSCSCCEIQWNVLWGKVVIRTWYVHWPAGSRVRCGSYHGTVCSAWTQFSDQWPFPGKHSDLRIPLHTKAETHTHIDRSTHTHANTQ